MDMKELIKRAASAGSLLPPGMTPPLNLQAGGMNKTPLPDSMLQAAQGAADASGGGGAQAGQAEGAPKAPKVDVGSTVMMLAKMLAVVIDKLSIDIPTGVMVQSPGDVAAFQTFMLQLAQGLNPAQPTAPAAQPTPPAAGADPSAMPAESGEAGAQQLAAAAMQQSMPKTAGQVELFVEPGRATGDASIPPRTIPLDFEAPSNGMRKLAGNAAFLWSVGHVR